MFRPFIAAASCNVHTLSVKNKYRVRRVDHPSAKRKNVSGELQSVFLIEDAVYAYCYVTGDVTCIKFYAHTPPEKGGEPFVVDGIKTLEQIHQAVRAADKALLNKAVCRTLVPDDMPWLEDWAQTRRASFKPWPEGMTDAQIIAANLSGKDV